MYVHDGKRRFFVTVREVKDDNTLGESESFSIYKSETNMTRRELVDMFIEEVNKTNKSGIE